MKALILNSGMGQRMGSLTNDQPKCMTEIYGGETILSHQLKLLEKFHIKEIIITTGYYDKVLIDYCNSLNLALDYTFINNPIYDKSNYIYSIYLAREYLNDDIILMHGDLVFESSVLKDIIEYNKSCMTVSSSIELPEKDFKGVIKNKLIKKIGIEFFEDALAAQPLYKLYKDDWKIWLDRIVDYCNNGKIHCYAENAFNDVSDKCMIYPYDYKGRLCGEIDTPEDLEIIKEKITKEQCEKGR